MRIQTFPPRLMWRVMAIRADSIWRGGIHPRSLPIRAKSPKLILLPWVDWPFMRPRIILRRPSLTRFGINITLVLLLSGRQREPGQARLGPRLPELPQESESLQMPRGCRAGLVAL